MLNNLSFLPSFLLFLSFFLLMVTPSPDHCSNPQHPNRIATVFHLDFLFPLILLSVLPDSHCLPRSVPPRYFQAIPQISFHRAALKALMSPFWICRKEAGGWLWDVRSPHLLAVIEVETSLEGTCKFLHRCSHIILTKSREENGNVFIYRWENRLNRFMPWDQS